MLHMRHVILFLVFLMLLWFLLQLSVLRVCFREDLSKEITCHYDKLMLLQNTMELSNEPACTKLLQTVKQSVSNEHLLPTIYIITPTYARPVQKAELTRLSHTFLLVPKVFWIVVEDAVNKTSLVTNFLQNCKVPHTHLFIWTPDQLKNAENDPNWLKPRGVLQRNIGLVWIRQHVHPRSKAVVYFADDDNTYDLKLFEEMRYTRTVSVWPVGLVGGLMVEKPLVSNGKVVGWNTVWKTDRPFPIDMAGFAVNATLLHLNKKASFGLQVPRGYQESKLLKGIVTMDQLEPKANNCTTVLVWHTRTERPKLKQEKQLKTPSNINIEV